MKHLRLYVGGFMVLVAILAGNLKSWAADLTINLVAVNAAEDKVKEIEVKYYLPKELEPEDVVDAGTLKLEYDVDKGAYMVRSMVQFQPKESKTFKIKVHDIWFIAQEEIDVLRKQLEENLELLKKKDTYDLAMRARDKLNQQLDFILAQQQNYSQNIERRIEEYRAYLGMLNEVRSNIYNLDYLASESKELEETPEKKTVKFMIEVKNPSQTEEKKITQKHFLPKEIRAENVVEKKGFDVRFDENSERAFLSKEESFKAGEVKKYEILLQDIWNFPDPKINAMQKRAESALGELKGSIYDVSGNFLFNTVTRQLALIRDSQLLVLPIKEHIGLYRVNQKRYETAKKDVERLEQLMAIVRAKKLEELESGKVKNVLQKLRALRGLAALSEALLKKGISVTTTWRIIFGTLGFLAFFTTLHFFIWAGRSKKMGEEKAGKDDVKVVPKPGELRAAHEAEEKAKG